MDLSKLSSNLPLSSSPTDESINNLNKELSDEFKIGARSIAALYRLSNSKNSLLIARGYLDCLNEISTYLENGNISSLSDLNHFITAKKNEMSPQTGDSSNGSGESSHRVNVVQNGIDNSFKFSVEHPANHHFPRSRTPLSMEHHNLKYYSKPQHQLKKAKNKLSAALEGSLSSDEEEIANASQEEDRAGLTDSSQLAKDSKNAKAYLSLGAIDEDGDGDDENIDGSNANNDTSFEDDLTSASLKRKLLSNSGLYKKQKLDS